MNEELKNLKAEYDATPIPEELSDRVQAGIRQAKRNRARKLWGRSLGSLAACFALLVGVLNVSATAASAAADIPVLGGLFQILTVRSYDVQQDGIDYTVSVPGVESEADLAERVNAEIQERVDALTARAQQDWADYQAAFFATGGTEEEWNDRVMNVIVDYEIKSQTDTTVSFIVNLGEGWITASQERYCYNLDLAEDRDITLADVLGEDWVSICNAAVQDYIAANTDADGTSFFFAPDRGGFTTVDETTAFYLNKDGTPVLVFPEYSIAAGAAGIVEIPVQ